MVNVSFPCVIACIAGTAAEEWQAEHWAWPKNDCLPRSSEAESVYRSFSGVPYLEASYFEMNQQPSPEDGYSQGAPPKRSHISFPPYTCQPSCPHPRLHHA